MTDQTAKQATAPLAVRLDLRLKSADDPIVYTGDVEIDGCAHPISVTIQTDAAAADGLASTATAPSLPAAWSRGLVRLVASMARKAVRGAHKDGLRPPHRIHRWRSVQP